MNSEILQTYIEALPGYKLIANKEVAIPYYSYNAHFLYSQKGMLPIVQDYVLEFIQLELNENTISSILGIPLDLIQDARYSLMQEDLIDPETEVLTELGEEYLACKKLDRLERGESNILINTLTSDIDVNVNNSMVHRDAQQYYCYKAPISTVTTETIDFRQMQKVLRIYCEKNEFDTDSKLIDIIYIKKKETRYRRLDILVFINVKEEIRLLAVENGQRRNRYEEILLELDNNGQDLLKTRIFKYFDGEYVQKIYEICNPLDIKQSVDYMDYISMSKDMTLIFPLIDSSIINNYIINEIEGKLHSKHTVNIILCGEKYSNTYQENMIQKLRKLAKKNKKLVIRHCIEYFPFIHINAEGTNCIQFLSLCNLNLKSTTNGVLSYYNNVSIEKADEILNLINSVIAENQSAI